MLQWQLWFSDGGLRERTFLREQIESHKHDNMTLRQRNINLEREILDLKQGDEVIERRAREKLGLVKSDEIFYQFVDPANPIQEKDNLTREVK